jgi:hypothetical protein
MAPAYAILDIEALREALQEDTPVNLEQFLVRPSARAPEDESVDESLEESLDASTEEFENEVNQGEGSHTYSRYRTMEAASLRLQKEAKGYLDSLRGVLNFTFTFTFSRSSLTKIAMTASQMRIAETIDAFYGDSGAKDGVSRSYKQAVEDLDTETIKALDGPYR